MFLGKSLDFMQSWIFTCVQGLKTLRWEALDKKIWSQTTTVGQLALLGVKCMVKIHLMNVLECKSS